MCLVTWRLSHQPIALTQNSVLSCRYMMNDNSEPERRSRQAPQRSMRWVFSLLYIAVIGAVIYFNIVSLGKDRLLSQQTWVLAAILLLLLAVERFEQRWSNTHEPIQIAVALLLARVVLLAGVTALDPSGISTILYPIIPYAAYFSLGESIGDMLAIATWVVYMAFTWLSGNVWYANDPLTSTVVFTLILVFMMTMARAINADELGRQHTEQLLADLEVSHIKLQLYADQVAELAAMEERNRLARDIHDTLGHYLTAVNIQLEKALAYQEKDPEEADRAIREAKFAAGEALRDVRRSVGALRSTGDRFSLEDELQSLVKGVDNSDIFIELTFRGDETGYQRLALLAFFRAAQEGLTNIQKYAEASHVNLMVDLGEQEGWLSLRDNGQGFETAVLNDLASSPDHSFGLQGIEERLELVGGRLQIKSDPLQGTELLVTIPKNPAGLISDGATYKLSQL